MLLEFSTLEERNPRDFQRVTQAVAYLLRHQFVHTEDRGSAPMLETLRRPHLAKLLEDYFEVAGYRLVFRETEGWAGILPDPERIGMPRMRIDETIALLVLRRLWEEALQEGEIYTNGTVHTSFNEAYAAYEDIVAGSARAAMSVADFRGAVQSLERRSVVRLGEVDAEAQDMDLSIRALIVTVAGDDFLASLEQLLAKDARIETDEEPAQ